MTLGPAAAHALQPSRLHQASHRLAGHMYRFLSQFRMELRRPIAAAGGR